MSLDIQANVSLQELNTMAVPARAAYFTEVDCLESIKDALVFAHDKQLPVFVLGEGSNTVFKDNYAGLILHNRMLGIELLDEDDERVLVKVSAGENWHRFVAYALERGWFGLENLALIPGLVGAAPIQNIGAYGVEIKDAIREVEFFDFKQLSVLQMTADDCQFAYRDSIFKHALRGRGLISAVTLCLSKIPTISISYPALHDHLTDKQNPTPADVFAAVCDIRSRKLPDPAKIPNTGSFFKNPIVDEKVYSTLKVKHPDLIGYQVENGVKLAAAWLIDHAGWKEKSIEQVGVHEQQALVIINSHRQSGAAVLSLAVAIQTDIEQKFGVTLEIEPNVV